MKVLRHLAFSHLFLAVMMAMALAVTAGQNSSASASASASTNPNGPASLLLRKNWQKLYNIIETELKVLGKVKNMGAELRYRVLELHTEKLALIHEKENAIFLQSATSGAQSKGPRRTKASFFPQTKALYQDILQMGMKLMADHPQHSKMGEIFYTLALNDRDFSDNKRVEEFLLQAKKNALKKANLTHYITTSLAEYYYNEKQFPKAEEYYTIVIQNKDDEWLAKHQYNLAWCYLKNNKMDKALVILKQAFFTGKQRRYISIEEQVLIAIGPMHVLANLVQEAKEFYTANVKDPFLYLVKLGQKASAQGMYNDVLLVVERLNQLCQKRPAVHACYGEISQFELTFYRQFNKYDLFMATALKIETHHKAAPLSGPVQDDIISQIMSLAGHMQGILAKNLKNIESTYSVNQLTQIINYFRILTQIDSKNSARYVFLQGETFYSIERFNDAAEKYIEALKFNDEAQRMALLNSLLVTMPKTTFAKPIEEKYTLITYETYVKYYPKDAKSLQIFPRLFGIYLHENKNIKDALRVHHLFVLHWQKTIPNQEELRKQVTEILDFYIAHKDVEGLNHWIHVLQKGYLAMEKAYIEKAIVIMSTLLYDRYKEMDAKGNKEGAVQGFTNLSRKEEYPLVIRAESAFFVAILYSQLLDVEKSYAWLTQMFKMAKEDKIVSNLESIFNLSQKYFLLQNFSLSLKLSQDVLQRLCGTDVALKPAFLENAVNMFLLSQKRSEAQEIIRQQDRCNFQTHKNPTDIKNLYRRIVAQVMDFGDWSDVTAAIAATPKEMRDREQLFELAKRTYWKNVWKEGTTYRDLNRKQGEFNRDVLQFMTQLQEEATDEGERKKIERFLKLDLQFAQFIAASKKYQTVNFKNLEEKFDEELFGKELDRQINELEAISVHQNNFSAEEAQVFASVVALKLSDFYRETAQNLGSMTPRHPSAEYVKSFKEQMSGVARKFDVKANDYRLFAQKTVAADREILPAENFGRSVYFPEGMDAAKVLSSKDSKDSKENNKDNNKENNAIKGKPAVDLKNYPYQALWLSIPMDLDIASKKGGKI